MESKAAINAKQFVNTLCIIAPLQRLLLREGLIAKSDDAQKAPPQDTTANLITAGEAGKRAEFHISVFGEEIRHVECWSCGGLND